MKNTELTPENIALALQAILASNNQSNHPVMDLFQRQLEKQERKTAEDDRVLIEAQKQNAFAMDQKQKQVEAEQGACHHLKPNGRSNCAGQRDHSNNYHYFCQTCGKHYVNGELPGMLAIDPMTIGGPQL